MHAFLLLATLADVSPLREESRTTVVATATNQTPNTELMLSLDLFSFWLVLASFTEKYIDYINDTSHIAVPSSDPLSNDHFIDFQRLGPFELTHMDNMQALSTIMLALTIQQLRATDNGRALNRYIEAVVAAGPGRRRDGVFANIILRGLVNGCSGLHTSTSSTQGNRVEIQASRS